MRFIQREGTTGTITFSGDQARLIQDGQPVDGFGWTSGSALTGVPQGSYTLEVQTGGTSTFEAVSIGVIVAGLGQSNMQIWFRGPTAVPAATDTFQLGSNGSWGAVEGPGARAFTATLSDLLDAPVAIINSAVGGTALTAKGDKGNGHWLDASPGSLYANAVADIDSVGGKAEFALWMQGETDAGFDVTTQEYATALSQLFGWVEADFGNPFFLIGELGVRNFSLPDSYSDVRAGQHQVADASSIDRILIGAGTTDLNTYDGIHMTGASRALAADRMAISALAQLGISAARNLVSGMNVAETLNGGAGRDELRGLGGADSINAGASSDVVFGGDGNDTVSGGDGVDYLRGDAGDDVISGDAGADVISGGMGNDSLSGGGDADEIWADFGNDTIMGGAGDDVLVGGQGDDSIDGGDGTDIVLFTNRRADYSWTITGNVVTIEHVAANVAGFDPNEDDGTDTLTGVELLRFSDQTVQLAVGNTPGVLLEDTAGTNSLTGGAGNDTLRGLEGDDTLDGKEGNDLLEGGAGKDTLEGGPGVDTLVGGTEADTYRVDVPEDVIIEEANGSTGDTVASTAVYYQLPAFVEKLLLRTAAGVMDGLGNDLANSMNGNPENNKLIGLEANDTLEGREGNDTLIGGSGIDTASYRGPMAAYSWGVSGQTVTIQDLNGATNSDDGVDTLIGVEILKFTDGSVTLPLTAAPSLFSGSGETVDFASVFAGAYAAGSQYDALGGDDHVTLPANAIAAIFAGYDTSHAFDAGAGEDVVVGGTLGDNINGNTGDDTLTGGGGNDTLNGGEGIDVAVFSGERSEYDWTLTNGTLVIEHFNPAGADEGVDTLTEIEFLQFSDQTVNVAAIATPPLFTAFADIVDFNKIADGSYLPGSQYAALAGNDRIVMPTDAAAAAASGYDPSVTFDAGADNDTIVVGGLAERINGGSGDDHFIATVATLAGDTLDGSTGTADWLDILGGGTFNMSTGASLTGFESVVLRAATTFTANATAGLRIFGSDAVDTITLANVGQTVFAGEGNDTVTGGTLADFLVGEGGNDQMDGGNGNDRLIGGLGADSMNGGIGNDRFDVTAAEFAGDTIDGGAGIDMLYVTGGGAFDMHAGALSGIERVALVTAANLTASDIVGLRIYGSTAADTITLGNVVQVAYGGSGNDTINGGTQADLLYGEAGNDQLNGGDGNDRLIGGIGADSMNGGIGDDRFELTAAEFSGDTIDGGVGTGDWLDISGGGTFAMMSGTVTGIEKVVLRAATNFTANGIAGLHVYGSAAADTITLGGPGQVVNAGGGNDTVVGGAGNDLLYGEGGSDRLVGGLGGDTLNGGAGADFFVFTAIGESAIGAGRDVIQGWDALDVIDLSAIDANTTAPGDQAFTLASTSPGLADLIVGQGQLKYYYYGPNTYIIGDIDGDQRADFQIGLIGLHTLDTGDFVL